ncbi:YsnF/AvaK domain-containing protein [Roseicella aerolata]|uniref:YsnF/AvaK domain-containing protein n=1 Tax=Roseicella aerolata TaxID=2883479 RepID=A0A9X1IHD7_9PROT|nr:YsnF/AvaK domain-containing protein [Roseicella aerolata]MCB4823408.1 YsnF/AvaK domain-containing protein [Roseicella aerolata]
MEGESAESVIPLLEEHLRIAKNQRATGRVRIAVTTGEETRLVEEVLRDRRVEIERVPVGRPVTEAPPVREEGDTLVIPVLEEVLVVERRLVLREEVRLRLRTEERRESVPVTLRRQQAAVERLPPPASRLAPNQQEAQGMRTITGLFDSRPDAERAVEYMVQHHDIDRNAIQVHAAGSENVTAGTHERRDESHHGFVASLHDLSLPEEDRITYAEGLRRGGILVSVRAPEDRLDKVADAFESNGAVDLEAREAEWRQGGWTGGGGGVIGGMAGGKDAAGPASTGTGQGGARATNAGTAKPVDAGIAPPPVRPVGPAAQAVAGAGTGTSAPRGTAAGVSGGAGGPQAPGMAAGRDEAIPIVEEQLRVGKRDVTHGRVRVRSYIVETPVEEQVRLREEHVQVERRPVDRPLGAGERADFQDRVIEANESTEEAVIDKEARVREEVVIRKEATERTETVSDTLRRTEVEVEVEDERRRGAGTPPRDPGR